MPCALFGKTPSKRDFIAPGAPRGFLNVWEPWMQAGLSSSKHSLDRHWQERFLTAPIWRFWLGQGICGATVMGAFMPSLDGVGRYYPLTVLATARGGEAFAPPQMDMHAEWFAGAENYLLDTLEATASFEDISTRLDALPVPAPHDGQRDDTSLTRLAANCLFAAPEAGVTSGVFSAFQAADWLPLHAQRSYWWTEGGDGFAPQALAAQGMPPAEVFAGFLTGDYSAQTQRVLA